MTEREGDEGGKTEEGEKGDLHLKRLWQNHQERAG